MIVRPHFRPSAPQGHQYGVHTLQITLCCISRFLPRNRMVARVLAKTTKVKNNFINGKKKVQKFNSSSYEFAFEDFIFVVGSVANSVGTTLEFTAFGSGPDPNLAELVPSGLFCPQPWFLRRSEHIFPAHFPKKNTRVYVNRPAINKQLFKY